MKTKRTKQKGITLIALVITIIVLLILAGVSIAMLTGQNGILSQANNAKIEQSHGAVEDSMSLAYNEYQIEINTANTEKIASTTKVEIKGEEENYLANSNTFMDFLLTKGYIEDKTSGKINVENLTGSKQALGNGTGETDIYKVEENNGTYIVNYYNKEGTPEEIWNASATTSTGDEELDWDKILEEATEKHPEQTESNDIGVGTDGKLVDLDLWRYVLTEDKQGYDLQGWRDGSFGNPGYIEEMPEGKIKGTVPQYIREEGGEFLPVTQMTGTFICCKDLLVAPKIPTTVTSMTSTFEECSNLKLASEIPESVIEMDRTFEFCRDLGGYLIINANPKVYTECFNDSSTYNGLMVRGKSEILEEIVATKGENSNIYIISNEEANFIDKYLSDKLTGDLENIVVKSGPYNGTFDEYLVEIKMTREEFFELAPYLEMTNDEYLKYSIISNPYSWVRVEYYSSKNGWNGKTASELEPIFAETLGLETFDDWLSEMGMTREEFETEYKEKFEKEEDFLKYFMTGYILGIFQY